MAKSNGKKTAKKCPEPKLAPIGEMEHHCANEILKMLLAKFDVPQIADILQDMGHQLVSYTTMQAETQKAAIEERNRLEKNSRKLGL